MLHGLDHRGVTRALARLLAVTCAVAFCARPAAAAPSDHAGPIRTETYGYDALHRLTSVNYGDGQTQGYTFDAMGNRLTKTDSVAGNDTYSYNAANMLLSRNGGAYTNDANGNTLTGGGRTNTWDGQNRLTQCVFGGTTTTHTYGADGLRRRTVQGAVTTDFVLMGDSVVRELRAGATHATYLHGPRGPEYRRDAAGNARWYLYDGLGSVLGEVDAAGNVTASRKLDVYGAVRATTGTATSSHGFVGGLGHPSEAETGLVYMRARYYDPVLGRFASEDPIRDGSQWYNYASCRATCVVDVDGRSDLDVHLFITGLAGMAGGTAASRCGAMITFGAIVFLMLWLGGADANPNMGFEVFAGETAVAIRILRSFFRDAKASPPTTTWKAGGIAREVVGAAMSYAGFLTAFMGVMYIE
jgi:RHS repeat-associated protein